MYHDGPAGLTMLLLPSVNRRCHHHQHDHGVGDNLHLDLSPHLALSSSLSSSSILATPSSLGFNKVKVVVVHTGLYQIWSKDTK